MGSLRVILAGATGWAGASLAKAINTCEDLQLTAAISRKGAGENLGALLNDTRIDCPVYASAATALAVESDIFFEYTKPDVAKEHILRALESGLHVVVGTSGLTSEEYEEIGRAAESAGRGVLAVGNFALTAVLLQKFAEIAARYIEHWEIIDYAHDGKIDAPSGTTRELANRLSSVRKPTCTVPLDQVRGEVATRGATVSGTQIHSLRLPGYVIGAEVLFGMPDQKLIIRHEAGASAEPYVAGALMAIRKVSTFSGLRRGLDSVMNLEEAA